MVQLFLWDRLSSPRPPTCITSDTAAKLADGCQAHEAVNEHKVLIFGNYQDRGDLIEAFDGACDPQSRTRNKKIPRCS